MNKLTTQQQINLLTEVIKDIEKSEDWNFLCHHIARNLRKDYCILLDYESLTINLEIKKYFPLFTWKNAKQFEIKETQIHRSSVAWWHSKEKEKRIQFLNWMINTLKTDSLYGPDNPDYI